MFYEVDGIEFRVPLLSVVVPAVNSHSGLIRRSIASIALSSVNPIDVVLVWTGEPAPSSTGMIPTSQKARSIELAEATLGQAIDRGIAEAEGDFVCVLIPGSSFQSGALDIVAERFICDPDIDVLHGACIRTNPDDSRKWRTEATTAWLEQVWESGTCNIAPSATFVRRALFHELGGCNFDEVWDLDLWLRLKRAGARFEPEPRYLAEQYERFAGVSNPKSFASELVAVLASATERGSPWDIHHRRALSAAHGRVLSLDEHSEPMAALRHLVGASLANPWGVFRYASSAASSLRSPRFVHGPSQRSDNLLAWLALLFWASMSIAALRRVAASARMGAVRK